MLAFVESGEHSLSYITSHAICVPVRVSQLSCVTAARLKHACDCSLPCTLADMCHVELHALIQDASDTTFR
jgi:hypothetical protein